MFNYAQLNLQAVVIAITQSPLEINAENIVPIAQYDESILGKQYLESGEFIDIAPPPIRKITVGSMRSRFTLAEKVAIKTSADPVVQVLSEDMSNSNHIDLDYQELIDGLNYLQSVGVLAAGRVAELLVDGSQDEAF